MSEDSVKSGPSILILGGVGFVGRNLLSYIVANQLSQDITIADKTLPPMARMNMRFEDLYNLPIVTMIQCDLTKEAHLDRVFPSGKSYDFVINLAAETRYGLGLSVYESRCKELSINCARRSKNAGVQRYVEVSTAFVYKSQAKAPCDERAAIEPCNDQARSKRDAEVEILKMTQDTSNPLNAVILRPSFIYGPEDWNGLMPRIVCAASYIELKETMKFLWDARMKINTVHVEDVCRAIWHVISHISDIPKGSIFNVSDESDTDQGIVNDFLGKLFGIETGFHGTLISTVARLRLADAVEAANDKHLKPWDTLCRAHDIHNSPLSPYMSYELLNHHHLYVNGQALLTTGFRYLHPRITSDLLRQSIENAIQAENFPPVLVVPSSDKK